MAIWRNVFISHLQVHWTSRLSEETKYVASICQFNALRNVNYAHRKQILHCVTGKINPSCKYARTRKPICPTSASFFNYPMKHRKDELRWRRQGSSLNWCSYFTDFWIDWGWRRRLGLDTNFRDRRGSCAGFRGKRYKNRRESARNRGQYDRARQLGGHT